MGIEVRNLSHIYNKGTPMEAYAVKNVSFTLEDGSFTALIGHTGSGKSTLIQHLNGLEQPTAGTVLYNGEDIFGKDYDLRGLRGRVGLVFQYPEYQLFEETVLKDVMFGPSNLGLGEEECRSRAEAALQSTGLGPDYYDRSPFELSGGEKRRAAIAGILAMEPEVLVLDEPAAGLDPKGRDEMLGLVSSIHRERNMAVLLVSHNMEEAAEYADRILVMNNGELIYNDTPKEVFRHVKELEAMGLSVPELTYLMHDLKAAGFDVDTDITGLEDARTEILRLFGMTGKV
ncbi:MAG: energy-coupling factor transporter ATPase [Eubacteriales bacterium]|nr:energy-coupling factor transporter ATPase [Eubacteriales bacterium]